MSTGADSTGGDAAKRILLVDDNELDRKIVRRMLRRAGLHHEVVEARTGDEACRAMAEQAPFDCVLLDYRLPDADGLHLAERWLADGDHDPCIILLTGQGSEELAATALKSGMIDYVPKVRLTEEGLNRAVERAVERVRLTRQKLEAERQLEAKSIELQRSNELLENFASLVSHDLKNPLASVGGFARLLAENERLKEDEEARHMLSRVIAACERMTSIIEGCLAFARLGTDQREEERVCLQAVARDVIDDLSALASREKAQIEVDALPEVLGRHSQLVQLFENLVANAIKFRHPERLPIVEIRAERLGRARVRIDFIDNGKGIPPEERTAIFGLMSRANSARRLDGCGIGLALCKRITEGHGGCIWVDVNDAGGSIFRVELPTCEHKSEHAAVRALETAIPA